MAFVETSGEIEVSSLMKHFRHQEHTHSQEYVARQLAENWGEVEETARVALSMNKVASTVLRALPVE